MKRIIFASFQEWISVAVDPVNMEEYVKHQPLLINANVLICTLAATVNSKSVSMLSNSN